MPLRRQDELVKTSSRREFFALVARALFLLLRYSHLLEPVNKKNGLRSRQPWLECFTTHVYCGLYWLIFNEPDPTHKYGN